jgi:periplasmic divalent cation tolerance protein
MVLFKTTDDGVEALRRRILDLHGYDVPEVLALPVVAGHGPYLHWVARNVTEAGENP